MDKPRIVNLRALPAPAEREHGDKFASSHVPLGAPLGATKLGYNLTEIPEENARSRTTSTTSTRSCS